MMRAPRLPPDGSAREVEDRTDVVAAAWGSARDADERSAAPLARDRECCSMRLTPRLLMAHVMRINAIRPGFAPPIATR